MPSNYDNSAWFYDRLSRVVYGRTLIKAQTHFLHNIPANSNILIAGGGTGLLLEAIAKVHPPDLQITYVELSAKMLARAKNRNAGSNKVTYINKPVESAGLSTGFDVIITPFLLDSLSPISFINIFAGLDALLKPGGLWLNTDFQLNGKWWHKPLLKSMYFFFRLMRCVETTELPDINGEFAMHGYRLAEQKMFFKEFITTSVYIK